MKIRVWGACVIALTQLVLWSKATAQEATDSLPVQTAFAESHLSLDLDGLKRPWVGRPYYNQRIHWTPDSLGILHSDLQNEWVTEFSTHPDGVILYQVLAGDTTGIPIAYDLDTYRMVKSDQNTLADWQRSVQAQLELRDSQKARDLVAISLPFKLPKAVTSIVGEGGAGLKVNGFKRIEFSGRSQWTDAPNTSSAQAQSKFPSLDMEQTTQMTITGKIGSKIEVKVDQDSRRVTDLGNSIQLRYRGSEDEILQTIEAGNTNLSLPNTQFVGYSQAVQGLFGVKAEAKVGHFNLTAIASQEKGSTEGASFTAGAQGAQGFIRDNSYLRYRYFWLFDVFTDTAWAARVLRGDSILTFHLYRTATEIDISPQALVMPTVPPGTTIDAARVDPTPEFHPNQRKQNMQLIEETDYFVDRRELWVTLADDRPIGQYDMLGFYAEIQTPFGVDTVGAIATDATSALSVSLILTMLKPDSPLEPTHPCWILEWKNVYDLGVRDVIEEGLKVDVYRGARGTETQEGQNLNNVDGTRYMEILGLDRLSTNGAAVPDGLLDNNPSLIDRSRGHLVLPNSFPFAPQTYPDTTTSDTINILGDRPTYAQDSTKLSEEAPLIYSRSGEDERGKHSQYYLVVTTTERRTSYSLGRVNILEGSERVRLNGRDLVRGVDYQISYEIGQINFLSEEVLDPNANVTVDYEYEPFFSVDRKTLLGARGEFRPSQNFHWGATALFKSESQPDNQKPRLGEEPSRTWVYDTDIGLRTGANFLTKLTDLLPLVEANAPSNLDISAEFAQSLPNPNTLGEAFIDDFEASQEVVSLPLLREAWYPSSLPVGLALPDRGKQIWYNRFDPYRITEIYNKEEVPAEDRTQVLSLRLQDSQGPQKWGGISRSLSAGLRDLSNTQFIEFRIQGNQGRLVFNLGKISEDLDGLAQLNNEDRAHGTAVPNGILDDDEDTGLDGLFDAQEPGYHPDTLPDPSGDNWAYDEANRDDYSRLNGTEGNRQDLLRGWLPDTEDINGNNGLDLNNHYFEFELDLADPFDPFLVKNSDFCNDCSDGATLGPWRTFRIPISDSVLNLVSRIVGTPSMSEVEFMRLYITGVDSGQTSQVNIADMNLVSYRWRDVVIDTKRDSNQALLVSVVNTRENSDYTTPPGVEEVVDRVTLIGQGEQSLLIGFTGLLPRVPFGDTSVVVDTLADSTADTTVIIRDVVDRARVSQRLLSAQDFTGYRTLEMYVHGDDTADGQYEFFLQFGTDSLNFYEYHTPIYPGWSQANFVRVDFEELTGFKFEVQQELDSRELREVDTTLGNYRLRGNPSLSRVEYLAMGVTNLDAGAERGGNLWVDELRLTQVRRDQGWAGRVSVNTNFSDFGAVGVNYRAQNYAFKTLTSGRANVVNSSSQDDISVTARISPEKILPPSIPLQMPVSFTWGRSKSTPYFLTRSDVVVPEESRDAEASTTERSGISVGLRYARQGGHLFERVFLVPWSGSFSTSRSTSTSPTTLSSKSSSNTAQARYAVALQKVPALPFLYWTRLFFMPRSVYMSRLELLPNRFAASGNYSERSSTTQYVAGGNVVQSTGKDFAGDFNLGYAPIRDLTFDYTYRTSRDLRDPNTVNLALSDFRLGVENNFNQSYRTAYTNRWIWFLEQRYSWDVGYVENRERQTDNTLTTAASRDFQAGYGLTWLRLVGQPNPKDRWFTWKLHQPVRKIVRGVLRKLDNLSFSFGRSHQIRAFGYEERPWWGYVWGVSNEPEADQLDTLNLTTSRNSESIANSISARSGLALLGSRITMSYNLRLGETNNSSNVTRTRSETFPSVRVTYTDLSKLALIKRLMNSATLEFGYDVKRDSQYNASTGQSTSASEDVRFSPLIGVSMNWRGNVSTQVKIDHSERTQRQPSSVTYSQTRGSEDDITFGLRYSFSAPGGIRLPLLSSIRLTSTMNLSVSASYGKSRQEQSVNRGVFQVTSERTTFTVQPQAGYSFSQTLTGGLRARWQDTEDKIQQSRSHVRELGFWVEFRF